jgi:arylsulfatase A-like enzyme
LGWLLLDVRTGVTSALTSTLDVFPTLLSLAHVPLPRDRAYDGLDLTPLLQSPLRETAPAVGHHTLFHPDQRGDLSAMRVGPLKVHFKLTQAPPCVENDTRPVDVVLADFPFVLEHQKPVVFDLDKDPAETTPIQVSRQLRSALARQEYDGFASRRPSR